jgi:hypothetical protein
LRSLGGFSKPRPRACGISARWRPGSWPRPVSP